MYFDIRDYFLTVRLDAWLPKRKRTTEKEMNLNLGVLVPEIQCEEGYKIGAQQTFEKPAFLISFSMCDLRWYENSPGV